MANRDPNFDSYVLKIREVLDRLDYYKLLGVRPDARFPEIKKTYFTIAARFHPDRNRDANEAVKAAIYDIFKRLNEAYRVLGDHEKRKAYDAGLEAGDIRFDGESRRAVAPKTPEDSLKSREARQFYRQAAEALKAGNLMQAELHAKVARSREGESRVVDELLERIREAKAAKKKPT